MNNDVCELCATDGGELLYRDDELRIVAITGADSEAYRGFCRVVWNAHVKEMTDLSPTERSLFMKAVFKLEAVLREQLQPEKMNIASLGNMTPHLHWHVIPRFVNDATYPKPIWATPDRMRDPSHIGTLTASKENLQTELKWRRAIQTAFATKQ